MHNSMYTGDIIALHRSVRPVVLDDLLASPDSLPRKLEEAHERGFDNLHSVEFPHMSDYRKVNLSPLPDFGTPRSFSEASFSYEAATLESQVALPTTSPKTIDEITSQSVGLTYTDAERSQYKAPVSTYPSPTIIPLPHVVSFAPSAAREGTRLLVNLHSAYNLTSPAHTFWLVFGSRKLGATLTYSLSPEKIGGANHIVGVNIPPLNTTGWESSHVPLSLIIEDIVDGQVHSIDVGVFLYLDDDSVLNSDGTQRNFRKTSPQGSEHIKLEGRLADIISADLKEEFVTAHNYGLPHAATFYPDYQRPTSYDLQNPYGRPRLQHALPVVRPDFQYRNSAVPAPATDTIPSPTSWPRYSASTPAYQHGISLDLGFANASHPQISTPPTPLPQMQPALIRTSLIPSGGYGYQNTSKASLNINGNLEDMALHWTTEEWQSRRRLVHFKRTQQGSKIICDFRAVPQGDRASIENRNICISCIWWQKTDESKSECYVTSVDVLNLLAKLVAQNCGVEEKNRIRRNIEQFKPRTISKTKPDSEEFFKTIMGFPSPKPRNIEKDIKVFPWKTLSQALTKIISKFSAVWEYSPPNLRVPPPLTPAVSNSGYPYGVPGIQHQLSYADIAQHNGLSNSPRRSISGGSQQFGMSHVMAGQRAFSPPSLRTCRTTESLRSSNEGYYETTNYKQAPVSYLAADSIPDARQAWDTPHGYHEHANGQDGARSQS